MFCFSISSMRSLRRTKSTVLPNSSSNSRLMRAMVNNEGASPSKQTSTSLVSVSSPRKNTHSGDVVGVSVFLHVIR